MTPLTEEELKAVRMKARQGGFSQLLTEAVLIRIETDQWPKIEPQIVSIPVDE